MERNFVGLSNQGATCYMNSLLQTLYMTPEFRRSLYQWRYDPAVHGDEQDCIPLQLQRLFGQLQLSERFYVETTALTRSFQWDMRDSFLQHDVQEFCRVLFDAIEDSVKETPQARFINEVYEGSLVDFVKCLGCGVESRREDKFMDLSLTVRSEFQQSQTLEAALSNFLRTEELTDDNQYFCSYCQSKQDASKGLKFAQLPYVLVLQLKRFDLDFRTMQRVKLNDPVKFPMILNMEPLLSETPPAVSTEAPASEARPRRTYESAVEVNALELQAITISAYDRVIADEDKVALKLDPIPHAIFRERELRRRRAERQEQIRRLLEVSSHVYELYSVMVHSGSALGGHYYAYILDFDSGRWFNFNDSYVKEVDEAELESVQGSNASYAATAYLLMYRKVDPRNLGAVASEEVPDYVVEYMLQERERRLKEEREQAERMLQIQVRVFYRRSDALIMTRKDFTLTQLKQQAIKAFNLAVAEEDCRLRAYSEANDVYKESYTGRENCSLDFLSILNLRTLVLEDKQPDEEFVEYDPDAISIKVHLWRDEIRQSENKLEYKLPPPLRLQAPYGATVYELMLIIEQFSGVPVAEQRLFKRGPILSQTRLDEVSVPELMDMHLASARIYEANALYLEPVGPSSHWQEEVDADVHRLVLRYNLPDFSDSPQSLVIDRRKSVADLRALLTAKHNLDPHNFIIKRGPNGHELKNLQFSLYQSEVINQSVLFLFKGPPALAGQTRLHFYLAKLKQSQRGVVDLSKGESNRDDPDAYSLYQFYDLVSLNVSSQVRVADLKGLIEQAVTSIYPTMHLSAQRLRVRERYQDRLCAVLYSSRSLGCFNLYDNKCLAVQVLTEDDCLTEEDVSLVVRWWSPSQCKLSEPTEITVGKACSFQALARTLSLTYNFSVRPRQPSQLAVCRITYQNLLDSSDLIDERWHQLNSLMGAISGNPLFLGDDGLELV
jgi:ubiquitin C-terminal hydrolase